MKPKIKKILEQIKREIKEHKASLEKLVERKEEERSTYSVYTYQANQQGLWIALLNELEKEIK